MAEMEIVPVYRGNEIVLPITGVNAVMDSEGNNLPMIFAKKDATTSDAWDPDITYTTGQYCLDNNTLWRCLIQNENTKPTEGTYWTRETIGNNLVTTDGEGNRGYLKADGSFSPFSGSAKFSVIYSTVSTSSSAAQLRVEVYDYKTESIIFSKVYTYMQISGQTTVTEWFKLGYSTVTGASWTIEPIGDAFTRSSKMKQTTWYYTNSVNNFWVAC